MKAEERRTFQAPLKERDKAHPDAALITLRAQGLLGEGVASSTRIDPQAKGLGEYLRSRVVELPEALLEDVPVAAPCT